MNQEKTIAVVGAGIVGCSCALWLQKKGFSVFLIDPEEPGSGTSSGNACTIADYGCVPVNSPAVLKSLPTLMFSSNSPLSVDFGYALAHLPWMLRFLSNCRANKVAGISEALGKLLQKTYDGLDPLIEYCDAEALLSRQGCMYLYRNEREFENARASNQVRRNHGFDFTEVDSADIRELEPGLKLPFARGLLFKDAAQVVNPQKLVTRYFEAFLKNGGQYLNHRVLAIAHEDNGLVMQFDNAENRQVDRAVIAAGAFSTQIKDIGASRLPLDTERGYHVQYRNKQSLLNRPVCWNAAGFYATPTDEGLRFAGTVEIAGYGAEKNPRNIKHLIDHSQLMFDLPKQPDQDWLGYRPTFPDALPVIGHSPSSEYVLYAFGHQHIGLTLAGITGKLIAELINNEPLSHDIEAFNPRRFL